MKTFGFILVIVGFIGIISILILVAYSTFGWIGSTFIFSALSVAIGLFINDAYSEEEKKDED